MERFGPYRITRELGSGGCGTVYVARRDSGGPEVALKLLEGPFEPAEEVRFAREVAALSRLTHPHVVKVYESGTEPCPWLAMELVRGGSVADELARSGPLPVQTAVEVGVAVADAVGAAHAAGFLHRDIKPANVLLRRDGTPLLGDFGLARSIDPARGLTRTGEVIGSPGFLAPEQCGGDLPHSPATDVYGVGALLYTCLSGEPPFRGALLDVLRRVLEEPAAPLRSRAPAVDPALAEIVERCLAKDPHERYRDGGTLARELRAWRIGLRPEEKRGTWSPELKVGAGLCALALLTGWAGQRFQRESPPAQAKASSPAPSPTGSPAGEPTPADVQPFDADAELTRAIEENRAGKSQDALRRVERVLERAPSARAYGDYGGLLATQGDFFRAQQAYEEGLKHVDPRDRELWAQLQMRLALIDARRGQRTAQRRRLDEVLARWPNAEGYRMRSDARIALLDRAGALADIEESLRLEPRSADGLSIQGALLAQQGDLVGARKALETALELQPERESVRANLARIMAQARRALEEARQIVDKGGDSRRAERLLERALACGDLDATYLLAMAKVRNGGPTDEIKRLLLEAAEGGHLAACFDVGINYERGIWGEPEASKAEDYYRRAAEAGAVPAMLRLATLYQRGGRSEDAERWRQRAEEAGSADAKAWRADLLHAAGEVEEAMALWQEAREAKSGWACYSLALRAEDRCAVEEAAALLEEAIELGDLRACVRRGKHLLASGGGEDVKRRARDLFHRAAVQGNLAGVVLLGEVLLDLQDARAAAWLRRGAQRGAPRAMLNYGHYLLAQDGPPLHEEGVGWLGRALRLGERVARSRLETALKTFEASEGPDSPRLTARCLEALAFERPELLERAKRRYEEAAAAGDAKARARLEAWPR